MNLKEILETIVKELEDSEALILTMQTILVENKLLLSEQLPSRVQKFQSISQQRLSGIRASIAQLPNQPKI